MKTWQIATLITLVVIVTSLVTASAFVLLNAPKTTSTGAYTNYPYGTPTTPTNPQPTTPTQPATPTNPVNPPATATLTINNAVVTAQNYLTRLNNPDLAIKKAVEYTQNFYIVVYERSTGAGAFELVIDKYTGNVYPENGPSATWNTKYGTANGAYGYGSSYGYGPGMMGGEGGMMGGYGGYGGSGYTGVPTTVMPVTSFQAAVYVQQYLNAYLPGTTTGNMTTFYGYYTVEVLSAGKTYGILSINGYNGQAWFHNWHGTFIREIAL